MTFQRPEGNVGLVAFSFGLRSGDQEPNPCNVRLAENVARIVREVSGPVDVVAQWEVARALEQMGVTRVSVVDRNPSGAYLDSEGVWEVAREQFSGKGIRRVIPVAQPYLQLHKVKHLVRADGFELYAASIDKIGFDSSSRNTQWWTRGWLRLAIYSIGQSLRIARPRARAIKS